MKFLFNPGKKHAPAEKCYISKLVCFKLFGWGDMTLEQYYTEGKEPLRVWVN